MWYGQYRAIENIYPLCDENTIVLNMRIDFFTCKTTKKYKINEDHIIQMCKTAILNPDVMVFSHDSGEYDGIDNVCVSGVEHMRELIHHFHLNLDKIATQYEYLFFHENMVFYESRLLSGKPIDIDAFSYMTKIFSNQVLHSFNT